jgi:hypothetical protein
MENQKCCENMSLLSAHQHTICMSCGIIHELPEGVWVETEDGGSYSYSLEGYEKDIRIPGFDPSNYYVFICNNHRLEMQNTETKESISIVNKIIVKK